MALLLSGCMVGPDYVPPRTEIPGNWTEHAATAAELARTSAQMQTWWATFHDPVLDRLVQLAIASNLDLQIAGQRLLAAHDVRDEVAAQLAPQVDTVDQAGIQRFSTTLQYPPLPGISSSSRYWAPGFSASWELDVFGRIRRGIQAQDDELGADIEARRGMLVAILGELADDYVTLRATQRQLVLARQNIEAARQALALTGRVFTQGLGTNLQVAQARAELETEQSSVPPLQTRIAQLTHAIAVLVGQLPGSLETMLERPAPYPKVPALPVALPSMVIANRPDIRRAERQYAEASARIGVAVAQLYPDFSLPLSLGVQSSMIHELFAADSLAFQLVLSAAQPLYHGGRLSAQVRQARAEAEAARLAYRQTVLTGFREVEDRLVAYRNDSLRDATLRAAAADNALALDRARRLYEAGLVGFLDVLTAERATYQSQDLAALGDLAELTDAVGLYTALGAGWRGVWLTDTQLPVDERTQHGLAHRLDHLRRQLFP
ncbi:efflux transporter outer membrane subunit [Lichenicoccus sp.]|uniref:efflux transporter outer membrane subunit n=1 Tax=Lichenicoccus sp. TaxID=2781899 RepID=UPI003D0D4FBC